MDFRIAAHPENDAAVVKIARAAEGREVLRGEKLVAVWYPIADKATSDLRDDHTGLVTRSGAGGATEVLALVGPFDLDESDVRRVTTTQGAMAEPVLSALFSEGGGRNMGALTSQNIGRHLVEVMDGHAYAAPIIRATVSDQAIIGGTFTEDEVATIAARLPSSPEEPGLIPYRHVQLVFRIFLGLALLVLLVLVLRWLARHTAGPVWWVVPAVIGAILGGYYLGVDTYTEHSTAGAAFAVVYRTHISILWVAVGLIAGAGVGVAVGFAARRLFCGARRTRDPQRA